MEMSSKPLDLDLEVNRVIWAGNIDMNLISEQRVLETRSMAEMAQNEQVE